MKSDDQNRNNDKPVKILVVEDVVNVATVLKARLESYGYQICSVEASGQAAIAGAIKFEPDLVLMDIMLEGDMNGIEAARQILEQVDIPIIYLSCLNDKQVMDRAIETNPYGYILKPYDGAELRFSIENALRKHQLDQQRKARIAALEKERSEGD